ncbi:MAG TPA: hypothetical protein VGO72_05960 [Herminiimonas sp.]|jgi:hypothetical protein|nr:hypothetical protein [Herminiimonas sp.]
MTDFIMQGVLDDADAEQAIAKSARRMFGCAPMPLRDASWKTKAVRQADNLTHGLL